MAGVITGAGLDLVVLLVLDLKLPVGAVELGVAGCVADVVLAAQFGRDLVKGVPELVELVAYIDDAAAGCLGKFSHLTLAVVNHSGAEISATVSAEKDIDDGVR